MTASSTACFRRREFAGVAFLCLGLLLAAATPARPQGIGTFATFDAPGAGTGALQGTMSICIDAVGDVAGFYADANSVFHGFIRAADGTITAPIDAPGSGEGMGQGTFPLSMNTAGEIAGMYLGSNGAQHGFFRTADGTITSFDVPSASAATNRGTNPLSIDISGDITGTYTDVNSDWHAFIRAADGTFTAPIDAPGAGTGAKLGTQAISINSGGDITGNYNDPSFVRHGFIRSANGTFTAPIDAPGAGMSGGGTNTSNYVGTIPLSIDRGGDITGVYSDTSGVHHAFVLPANGTIASFDAPGAAGSGKYQGTFPSSINTAGIIAGTYGDSNGVFHGFMRTPGGTITTFDVPGAGSGPFQGTVGVSLNDMAVITGGYLDAGGALHGYVLTPTTVPVVLEVTPSSLGFGSWADGNTSGPQKVTLSFISGAPPWIFSSFTFTGANPGDFAQANDCPPLQGSFCNMLVTFTPSTLGPETATLTVNDNASNSPQTVALSGTGSVPVLVGPSANNFGVVAKGTPSRAAVIDVANTQSVGLNIFGMTLSNPDFTEVNTCGGSLAPHAVCTISVTFTPGSVGMESATLSVSDSATNSPQTVFLSGTGK
jgi:hypothetical protein